MKKVFILLADGFEDIEAVATFDVLERGGVDAAFVGVTGATVTSSHGMRVRCDLTIEEAHPGDMRALVLPGGGRGVENLAKSDYVQNFIRYAFESGLTASAICAAPSLFGRLGYLDGKKFTCYPSFERYMPEGEYLGGERVVIDGNIVTGKAAGTSIDFALALLGKLTDAATAASVREKLYY